MVTKSGVKKLWLGGTSTCSYYSFHCDVDISRNIVDVCLLWKNLTRILSSLMELNSPPLRLLSHSNEPNTVE